eukprot:7159670-Prymnesium_polylepis.1
MRPAPLDRAVNRRRSPRWPCCHVLNAARSPVYRQPASAPSSVRCHAVVAAAYALQLCQPSARP